MMPSDHLFHKGKYIYSAFFSTDFITHSTQVRLGLESFVFDVFSCGSEVPLRKDVPRDSDQVSYLYAELSNRRNSRNMKQKFV